MLTKDPEVINHILQKNHKNYVKSKIVTDILSKYAGKGILTTNGDYWLKQRRLIQPGFHKSKIESLLTEMNAVILNMMDDLSRKINEGQTQFDILDEMTKMTLSIVSKALFSTTISDDQINILKFGVQALQDITMKEAQNPFLSGWRKLSGFQKKSEDHLVRIYKLITDYITERRSDPEPPSDLMTMLLDARYEGTDEGMNNQQILDEILIIFIAGFETTTNALTFCLYLLSQHPEPLSTLRTELDELDLSLHPTIKEVMEMKYTTQVISESMRLYPPAWFMDRVAIEDDMIGEEQVKAGEIIALYTYGLHRSSEFWIDPDAFNPDRFSETNKSMLTPNAFIPFGKGPRLCIGSQFAQMEMNLVLYHFIKRFNFQLVQPYSLELDTKITIRPKYGMPMVLSERS
jgi:cytochrome P450